MNDILQYTAAIFIALAWILVSFKSKYGFIANFIGCSCWVIYALITKQWGLLGLNAFLSLVAILGFIKWKK